MSYPKADSVNRRVFTQGTMVPNYIPIGFEKTEPYIFWWRSTQQEEQNEEEQDE